MKHSIEDKVIYQDMELRSKGGKDDVAGAGDGGLENLTEEQVKAAVAQVYALFLGDGLVKGRNFDSTVLLALMAMPAIKVGKKATGGLI